MKPQLPSCWFSLSYTHTHTRICMHAHTHACTQRHMRTHMYAHTHTSFPSVFLSLYTAINHVCFELTLPSLCCFSRSVARLQRVRTSLYLHQEPLASHLALGPHSLPLFLPQKVLKGIGLTVALDLPSSLGHRDSNFSLGLQSVNSQAW